jgi:protease-4
MKKRKQDKSGILDTIDSILHIIRTTVGIIFTIAIGAIFILLIISFFGAPLELVDGNVALIPVNGKIISGEDSSSLIESGVQAQKIIDRIKDADEDESIKAIVIEINSPGGSPVASYEIAKAIKTAAKPTIALIREQGASGAFWAATAAQKVFANPMSVTGSIGVIGSYVELAGLLDRYNMTYRRLVSGQYKDALSRYKELTPEEAALFQQKLNKLHDYFITAVAENRKLSKQHVIEDANGFIMLGEEAKAKGYVDYLGGREEVKEYLKNTLGIEPKFREYSQKKGLFDAIGMTANTAAYFLGKGIGATVEEELSIQA